MGLMQTSSWLLSCIGFLIAVVGASTRARAQPSMVNSGIMTPTRSHVVSAPTCPHGYRGIVSTACTSGVVVLPIFMAWRRGWRAGGGGRCGSQCWHLLGELKP